MDGKPVYLRQCPKAMVTDYEFVSEIMYWRYMIEEKGILPNAGGYYDQASIIFEGINTLNSQTVEYSDAK